MQDKKEAIEAQLKDAQQLLGELRNVVNPINDPKQREQCIMLAIQCVATAMSIIAGTHPEYKCKEEN